METQIINEKKANSEMMEVTPTTTAIPTKDDQVISMADDKKYETIKTIKINDGSNLKMMDKPSVGSSINLLPATKPMKPRKIPMSTKLGIIQLLLSIVLSALGGLLIARNASLSSIGSGVWSGIIAGVVGALGLMNIKPLLNGFLAVSLISVATSTLALALTGIGLIRDYNISHLDEEIASAVHAATWLVFALIFHLLTSIFSVYYSALLLCSKQQAPDPHFQQINIMNYQKVQDYLRSMQNGTTPAPYFINTKDPGTLTSEQLIQGYTNYMANNAKMMSRRPSYMYVPHPHFMPPMYPPPPSSYMTSSRAYYNSTLPPQRMQQPMHHQHNQQHLEEMEHIEQFERSKTLESRERRRKSESDVREQEIKLSYTGLDREVADSYLEQQEKMQSKPRDFKV